MRIDILDSLIAENQEMLSQYYHRRKTYPLDEAQQKRVDDLIKEFWFYRSHAPLTVYTAYGVHDIPVTYMHKEDIDQYVIESEQYEIDDFEYCVETEIMTGRQIGDLMADW